MSDTQHKAARERLNPEKAADEQPKTVTVRYDGAHDLRGTEDALVHEGHRLPRGQEVEVPADVADLLTSGDNALLYRVVRV